MKGALHLAATVAAAGLSVAAHCQDVIVYDNTTGQLPLLWAQVPANQSSGPEGGDEVTLAGMARRVTKLDVYITVSATTGATPGTADTIVRIYANDGPPDPTTTFPSPGTILWNSGVLLARQHAVGLNQWSFDVPAVLVPDTITWTIEFMNRQGSTSVIGPHVYNPPTVGTSRATFWMRGSSGQWVDQLLLGTAANFGSRVTAVSQPPEVKVLPDGFSLFRGVLVSGDVQSLHTPDDNRLVARPGVVLNQAERPVQVIVEGTASQTTASSMKIRVESHANIPNISQWIEVFNWTSNTYTELDMRTAPTVDMRLELTVPNPGEHINSSGELRARISYKEAGPVFSYPWFARIDEATWLVTP